MEDDDGSWKSYREKEKQRENIKGRGRGKGDRGISIREYFSGGGDRFFFGPCIHRRGMNIHNFTFVDRLYRENFYEASELSQQ